MTDADLIYLDNGATTPVDPRVAELVASVMLDGFGNPSSPHRVGVDAARRLEEARARVARAIGAASAEVVFTSGGTEANNLGFVGGARAGRGTHLLVSAFEHPSILAAAEDLAGRGFAVTRVEPGPSGVIDAERFAEAVRPDTACAALMWVQNEIGTVQPVAEAARRVKARAPRCHVHVDGVQALGKLPIDVAAAPFDSLSLSAHKIHGPKGAGALWLKRGSRVVPRQYGGKQERGLRPGTEPMPALCGFGLAVELAEAARPRAAVEMARLRDLLWQGIHGLCPDAVRHGDPTSAAPHVLAVGFPELPAEPLLHAVEAHGVCVSAGSACHALEHKPSATLAAIGAAGSGTLRFSLSRLTTETEIARAVGAVAAALDELSWLRPGKKTGT